MKRWLMGGMVLGLAQEAFAQELAAWGPSRGMALFWVAIMVLAAFPLLGRRFRTLAFLGAALLAARGLMRIISEHDVARLVASLPMGVGLGLQLAAGLVVANIIIGVMHSYYQRKTRKAP